MTSSKTQFVGLQPLVPLSDYQQLEKELDEVVYDFNSKSEALAEAELNIEELEKELEIVKRQLEVCKAQRNKIGMGGVVEQEYYDRVLEEIRTEVNHGKSKE